MRIDETNPIVMFFVNWIKHYNHEKYWKRRNEEVNSNSKYPKLLRLYWLFYIKIAMHITMHLWEPDMGGAAFAEPPILPHLLNGIIISYDAKIGRKCTINQQVTLAEKDNGHPVIGDNVFIGAGARNIGNVHIGDNVKIGPNAVIVKDVPSNCTVMGVPGVIVKRDCDF